MARPPRAKPSARGEPGVATRNRWLAGVGIAALIGFAIATLPASLAGGLFQRNGLSATRFSGTIWSGTADDVSWQGASLGELRWRLRPLWLLRARAAADITLAPADGSADATIAAARDGTLDFTNVHLDLPIEFFARAPTGIARGWHGRVNGAFADLRLRGGWPTAADGTLHLTGLVMPQLGPDAVGSFEIVVPDPRAASADSPDITARVKDTDGSISVDAVLTLSAGRSFLLEGTVAPRDGAPPGMLRSLQYLGPADAAGRRQFGVSGTL